VYIGDRTHINGVILIVRRWQRRTMPPSLKYRFRKVLTYSDKWMWIPKSCISCSFPRHMPNLSILLPRIRTGIVETTSSVNIPWNTWNKIRISEYFNVAHYIFPTWIWPKLFYSNLTLPFDVIKKTTKNRWVLMKR
jgi:hypothetical protein